MKSHRNSETWNYYPTFLLQKTTFTIYPWHYLSLEISLVVLIRNFFGGELLPSSILGFQKVEILVMTNCAFSGAIPPWIANFTKLKVLDLSWNLFSSTIPSQIANLDSLIYLDLSNNALSGSGGITSSLTNLKGLISKYCAAIGRWGQLFPIFYKVKYYWKDSLV